MQGRGGAVVGAFAVGMVALIGACSSGDDGAEQVEPSVPPTEAELPTQVDPDPSDGIAGDVVPGEGADGEGTDQGAVPGGGALGDLLFPDGDRPEANGTGVVVVVIDSGVDWRHPDLRAPDGSTRIAAIVDLSGQTAGCAEDRPAPVVIRRAEIDRSLADGTDLDHIDAVGRGTALVGLAAGDGAAAGGATAGAAADATLIVVKQLSEGVPPSTAGPGGPPVAGCLDDALDEVDRLLDELGTPAVLLAPTGSQWGPLDGTSAASRRLDASFGPDTPGRVLVTGSGDEGGRPNHARVQVTPADPVATVPFERPRGERSNPTLWYRGGGPLHVSIRFDDGTVIGPVAPGESISVDGVDLVHYEPGTEFHPWTSTSGDHAVWMVIERGPGTGEIVVGLPAADDDGDEGRVVDGTPIEVDVFGDLLGPQPGTGSIDFADHLAEARVTDAASTPGAVVVAANVARSGWSDGRGRLVEPSPVIEAGLPWPGSSTGPTRDGRRVVVVSAPGQHAIAPLAERSLLAERTELQPGGLSPDPEIGYVPESGYVVVTGTGAAAAIVAGVVAAMLEVAPALTGAEVAEVLAATAQDGRLVAASAVESVRAPGS